MNTIDVMMVRVYITEATHLLQKMLTYLQEEVKIRGVSVFRAISGTGESGTHSMTLLDLSLNLPITIEFFDHDQAKIEKACLYLNTLIKPEHMVLWEAKANVAD